MNVEQQIIEYFGIWTGAKTYKNSSRRGSNGEPDLTGIEKLRELILDLAVRGKLVPQDPEDEPATQLLQRVKSEKVAMYEAGRIRKPKPLPEIQPSERPYELPSGWIWERLGNYAYIEMGQSPKSEHYNQNGHGMPFFQGKADFGNLHPTIRYWCTSPHKIALPNDLLLSVRAPVGPVNMADIESCIGRGLCAIRPLSTASSMMLTYTMRAFRRRLEKRSNGTTFKAISRTDVELFPVPVPPENEQRSIAGRVDELMAICDRLEKSTHDQTTSHNSLVKVLLQRLVCSISTTDLYQNWNRVEGYFDSLFVTEYSVDCLAESVFDLAVTGKLSRGGRENGHTEELHEGVEENASVVRPVINTSNLPEGWSWCQLNDLALSSHAGWSPKCDSTPREDGEWGVLKVSAVSWGQFLPAENKRLPSHVTPKTTLEARPGDFLISRANTSELVGRSVVVPDQAPKKLMLSDKIIRIRLSEKIDPHYLQIVNSSPMARRYYEMKAGGTSSSMRNISRTQIGELQVPLPPYAEQQRIVERVHSLGTLFCQMRQKLRDIANTRVLLSSQFSEWRQS